MNEEQAIDLLKATIYLIGTWCFLMLYSKSRRDQFREEMLWLRDELDEQVDVGQGDAGSDAYTMLRKAMNGLIRSGNRLTQLHVWMAALVGRRRGEYFTSNWNKSSQSLDPAMRAKLESFRGEIDRRLVGHIFLGSPVFLATLVLPLLNWLKDGWVRDQLIKRLRLPLDNLVFDALVRGERLAYWYGQRRLEARGLERAAGHCKSS